MNYFYSLLGNSNNVYLVKWINTSFSEFLAHIMYYGCAILFYSWLRYVRNSFENGLFNDNSPMSGP